MTITIETMKKVLDAFNRHDLDARMEFFSDDCSFDFPRGPESSVKGCDLWVFRNGKIIRKDSYWKIVKGYFQISVICDPFVTHEPLER